MVLATIALNIGHPGMAFGTESHGKMTPSNTVSTEVIDLEGNKNFGR
jgi:hypothetical protein